MMSEGGGALAALAQEAVAALISSGRYQPKPRPPLNNVPTAYALQRTIIDHPARYKVVCAGRRVGKTIMAALMAKEAFFKAKKILLSSTSQDQADVFWDYISDWFAPLLADGLYRNQNKHIMRYRGGALRVKTGRKPDVLRGGQADLLVFDECAFLDPDAWYKVGAPMLLDNNGCAVFISTPLRRNWFFHLYQQAVADETGEWAAWNFSSHQNPYLPAGAINKLSEHMTEADYQQEILAQFLEGDGAVFRFVDERCIAPRCEPYAGDFVFGVDVAVEQDFTVITVIDTDRRVVVDLDRFKDASWAVVRGRIAALYERWQPRTVLVEQNSIGAPLLEALHDEGLPVRGFLTTAQSKPPLIESLVLAFERGEITALDDPLLKAELKAYERRMTASGRSQYSAPSGIHDDCVISLALAWHALNAGGFRFLFEEDELRG